MNNQRAEDEIILRKMYEDFLRTGLTGEADEFVAYFDEPYSGIGMGEQGVVHSKDEMEAIIRGSYSPMTGVTIEFDIQDFIINFLDEDAAVVCGAVVITSTPEGGEPIHSGVMQTFAVRRKAGKWTIGFTHASPMMLSEESIAAYPIKFADHTLSQLKAELQTDTFDMINASFSGGILGTYAQEPFPLFFANDRFIEMLGYEREEFEELTKSGTTQLNYIDDASNMEEKSREAYISEEDYALATRFIKKDGSVIWVEVQVRKTEDTEGNEIFLTIVTDITEIITLKLEAEKQHRTILESIDYASKIQKNLLPREAVFQKSFSDYSVIWEPRDIVGGDIYWVKSFEMGTVLCVCDCTGHGTPGALLTMLVVSALESAVKENNCSDTAEIMWKLEEKLIAALNVNCEKEDKQKSILDFSDGCDIAILFMKNDGTVKISAGNTKVFVCNGRDVQQIKGQKLSIGEGKIGSKEEIETVVVEACADNKFYIASDGLYDQIGSNGKKFGYQMFEKLILDHHNEKMSAISDKIWKAFETHRGEEMRRDDVELITFKP